VTASVNISVVNEPIKLIEAGKEPKSKKYELMYFYSELAIKQKENNYNTNDLNALEPILE